MPTAVELKPIGTVRLSTSHGVFLASSVVYGVETPYDPSTGHVTGKRQFGPVTNRKPVMFPPSGFVAGVYAAKDQSNSPTIVIIKGVDLASRELWNHHRAKQKLRSMVIALSGRPELKLVDVEVVRITKRADGLEEIYLSA